MRTTTQRVHFYPLMRRQEESISAGAIKSKITSQWEALTEKRAHLKTILNYVAT
jgi:hypothetical protein